MLENDPVTLGIKFPMFVVADDMLPHALAEIIEASPADDVVKFGFPLCWMPGVGIIAPTGVEVFTNCEC